mmetsp:Transcript_35653/g.102703  ORF Transcript_35653/g.102703 Transcript_35653/m.102703 type:complete len:426 (+) Transcript_35653:1057-2334(+)
MSSASVNFTVIRKFPPVAFGDSCSTCADRNISRASHERPSCSSPGLVAPRGAGGTGGSPAARSAAARPAPQKLADPLGSASGSASLPKKPLAMLPSAAPDNAVFRARRPESKDTGLCTPSTCFASRLPPLTPPPPLPAPLPPPATGEQAPARADGRAVLCCCCCCCAKASDVITTNGRAEDDLAHVPLAKLFAFLSERQTPTLKLRSATRIGGEKRVGGPSQLAPRRTLPAATWCRAQADEALAARPVDVARRVIDAGVAGCCRARPREVSAQVSARRRCGCCRLTVCCGGCNCGCVKRCPGWDPCSMTHDAEYFLRDVMAELPCCSKPRLTVFVGDAGRGDSGPGKGSDRCVAALVDIAAGAEEPRSLPREDTTTGAPGITLVAPGLHATLHPAPGAVAPGIAGATDAAAAGAVARCPGAKPTG